LRCFRTGRRSVGGTDAIGWRQFRFGESRSYSSTIDSCRIARKLVPVDLQFAPDGRTIGSFSEEVVPSMVRAEAILPTDHYTGTKACRSGLPSASDGWGKAHYRCLPTLVHMQQFSRLSKYWRVRTAGAACRKLQERKKIWRFKSLEFLLDFWVSLSSFFLPVGPIAELILLIGAA